LISQFTFLKNKRQNAVCGGVKVDYPGDLSALRFAKAQADKKRLKKMANAFSIPLALEQVFGVAALLISGVILMLVRVSVMHKTGSFSLTSFKSFLLQSNNSDWLSNAFSAFAYFSYMFIPFVMIAAILRQNPLKTVPLKIRHPELILPAISIGLLFSVAGEVYSNYFQSILQFFNLQVKLDQFSFPSNTPALIVYFFELSIFAPICEEFIFRGMILQNLRKYGDFFAVLVSSLMFGILHGNLSQAPFAFIVGIALGLVVIETGSIFVSMLLHCCINTVSLIFSGLAYYAGDDMSNRIYAVYILAVCVFAVISFVSLRKNGFFKGSHERYFSEEISVPQAVGIFAKTPGFIVFVSLYAILMLLSLQTL
jgi:uncharacterized protein